MNKITDMIVQVALLFPVCYNTFVMATEIPLNKTQSTEPRQLFSGLDIGTSLSDTLLPIIIIILIPLIIGLIGLPFLFMIFFALNGGLTGLTQTITTGRRKRALFPLNNNEMEEKLLNLLLLFEQALHDHSSYEKQNQVS